VRQDLRLRKLSSWSHIPILSTRGGLTMGIYRGQEVFRQMPVQIPAVAGLLLSMFADFNDTCCALLQLGLLPQPAKVCPHHKLPTTVATPAARSSRA
jgi:hypothetical protein